MRITSGNAYQDKDGQIIIVDFVRSGMIRYKVYRPDGKFLSRATLVQADFEKMLHDGQYEFVKWK